jgi:hypothetical protein
VRSILGATAAHGRANELFKVSTTTNRIKLSAAEHLAGLRTHIHGLRGQATFIRRAHLTFGSTCLVTIDEVAGHKALPPVCSAGTVRAAPIISLFQAFAGVPAGTAVVIVVHHIDALAVAHHLVGVRALLVAITITIPIAITIPAGLHADVVLADQVPIALTVVTSTPDLPWGAVGIHADVLVALEVAETQTVDTLAPERARCAAAIAIAVAISIPGVAVPITRGIAITVAVARAITVPIAIAGLVAIAVAGLARGGVGGAVVVASDGGSEREDAEAQEDRDKVKARHGGHFRTPWMSAQARLGCRGTDGARGHSDFRSLQAPRTSPCGGDAQ